MNNKTMRKLTVGIFVIVLLGAFSYALMQAVGQVQSQYADPNQPPWNENEQTEFSNPANKADVWQALFVINQDDTTYWANAPEPFSLASILGSQNGKDFKTVESIQNNIYMKLQDPANAWSFSCQETITVRDENGDLAAIIVDNQSVNANGQSAPAGQNLWVTGATVTASQLQSILNLPAGTYTFTVTLQNINLSVDGMQLSAVAGTSQNVLSWKIQIT